MGLRLVQSLVVSAASRVVGVRLPKTARLGEPARHARDGRAGRATARQQARRVEGRRLAPGSERAGAARRCPPVASARLAELMQRVERPLRSARPSCISRRSPATSCARSPTSSTCRLATTLPKKPPLRPAPRGRRSAVSAASTASSRMPLEPPVDAVVACCSMLSFFLLKKPTSLLCRTPPAQQQRKRAPGRRLLQLPCGRWLRAEAWRDNRLVTMISTTYHSAALSKVRRWSGAARDRVERACSAHAGRPGRCTSR